MRRLLAAILGGAALMAHAAQPNTETFAAGFNDWLPGDTVTGTGLTWSVAASNAAVTFPLQFFPSPVAVLTASNAASGGAYVGDHAAADLVMIGFDFKADTVRPDGVRAILSDGTNSFVRNFATSSIPVGAWTTLVAATTSMAGGGWVGAGESQFAAARSNVLYLRITITQSGMPIQTHRVDNIFIQTRPAVAALQATTNSVNLSGSSLQANVAYALESAETITSDWTTVSAFTATAGVSTVSSGTTNANFFRLRW